MKNTKKRLKLRKQWAILATIIICFTIVISYAFASAEPTFEIANTGVQTDTVKSGDELTYNIRLTNEKEYNSVQFSVIYDENVLEYVSNSIATSDDGVSYDISQHRKIKDGTIKWTFMFADSYQNNNADFGTITFRVKENAAGNSDIKLEDVIVQRDDFDNIDDPTKVIKYNSNVTNKTIFVEVPVIESSISVTSNLELDLGSTNKTGQINVSYLPTNTTDSKEFTYRSGDSNIATVDNNGLITAKNPGDTIIYVTAFASVYEVNVKVLSHIESIHLNETNITLTKTSTNAESKTLIATINPTNTTDDKTITWTSSNPSVATINNGVITAVGPGNCTITAKSINNKTAVASVYVSVPAETVSIAESNLTLNLGDKKQLTSVITPNNTNDKIKWESADNSIVSVDEFGLITATGKGSTKVKLIVGNKTAEVNITVEVPVSGIDIDIQENEVVTLYPSQTKTINASVIPSNATIQNITWTIQDNQIASISNNTITALNPGETTLKGIAGTKSIERKIKVLQNIESYQINIPSATLNANDQEAVDLKVTFIPATTDESQKITWTSSDSSVATVNEQGHVVSKSPGITTITGTFGNNKSVTSSITVVAPIKELIITNNKIKTEGANKSLSLENVGTVETLAIKINPDPTSTSKSISWTSSNPSVATINNGVITTKGKGVTTITATSANGITDSVVVQVRIPATSVRINESKSIKMVKGSTKTLSATITPNDTSDDTINWTSTNQEIASISNDGTILAKNAGKTTIKATAGNKTDTIDVEVIIPITSFNLTSNNQLDVLKGSTKTIETTINPNDTTEDKTITWTSSNENIAKVDENGNVTGLQGGNVTITGTLNNQMKVTVNVTVSIIPVNNMTMNITEINLLRQEKQKLEVTFDPENTTEKDQLLWEISDEEVATVENGYIVGKKEGTATLTGKLNNLEVTATINVSEIHLDEIKVIDTKQSIEVGEEVILNLAFTPANTTDDLIFTYKSSDESVASVDESGKIKGLAAGNTTITITHQNGIETSFVLQVKEPINPKTWDNISSYIMILIGSITGLIFLAIKKHKKI